MVDMGKNSWESGRWLAGRLGLADCSAPPPAPQSERKESGEMEPLSLGAKLATSLLRAKLGEPTEIRDMSLKKIKIFS